MAKSHAKPKTTRKIPKAARAKKTGAAKKPPKQPRTARDKAARADTGPAKSRPETKQAILIARLRRKEGATIAELAQATGWQAHSVRGAISGALKKKLGLAVTSEKLEGRGRVYRIAAGG